MRQLLTMLVRMGPTRVPGLPRECCSPLPLLQRTLALYRHLLAHFLSLKANLGVVSELGDGHVADFFGTTDADPVKFLSFSQGDIARIALVLDVDFVITSSSGAKVLDTRLWSAMGGNDRSPLFFRHKKQAGLVAVVGPETPPHPLISEGHVMGPSAVHLGPGDDQVRAILSLLAEPAALSGTELAPCRGLHNLLEGLSRAEDVISRVTDGGCVVLVAHLGLTNLTTLTPRKDTMQNFQVLGVFPRRTADVPREKLVVVAAAYPNTFYLPRPELSQRVLSHVAVARFQKSKDPKLDLGLGAVPRPKQPRGPGASPPVGPACPCTLCADGKAYDANFARGGQSQLPYRAEPHTLEYLRMFKLDTVENIALVKTACQLSIASMDCESITVPVPRGASDELVSVLPVGQLRHDGSARKTQRVVLFGHGDFLDEEVRFFEVDERRTLQATAEDYVEHLIARREEAERVKTALLKPLYDFVGVLRKAHEEYCREEGGGRRGRLLEDPAGAASQVPGQAVQDLRRPGLQRRAVRLPRPDHRARRRREEQGGVAQGPQEGQRHNVHGPDRQGQRRHVSGPHAASGRLLLARQTGGDVRPRAQEGPRALRPAGLHRGAAPQELLLGSRGLEGRARRKGGGRPGDHRGGAGGVRAPGVRQHRRLPPELSTNRRTPLRDCTSSLYKMFADMLDCHPVDARRYTIASLSYYCCQMRLFRDRRMAVYRPRVSPLYSVLRSACRGGLVQVTRNVAVCGDEEDYPSSGINSHLHQATPESLLPAAVDEADYPTPPSPVQRVLDEARRRPRKIALAKKGSTCPSDHLSARHIVEAAVDAGEALGKLDDARVVLDELRDRLPETGRVVRALDVSSLYSSACKYLVGRGAPLGPPGGGGAPWPLGHPGAPARGGGASPPSGSSFFGSRQLIGAASRGPGEAGFPPPPAPRGGCRSHPSSLLQSPTRCRTARLRYTATRGGAPERASRSSGDWTGSGTGP